MVVMPSGDFMYSPQQKGQHVEPASAFRAQSQTPIGMLPNTPSKDSREHSAADWELHKESIRQLYVVEKRKLQDMMKTMLRQHGFVAT